MSDVLLVRYFASLTDLTGCKAEEVQRGTWATVEDLWVALGQRHPGLAGLTYRPMVACDADYADWGRSLEGVREVSFLPPMSGG